MFDHRSKEELVEAYLEETFGHRLLNAVTQKESDIDASINKNRDVIQNTHAGLSFRQIGDIVGVTPNRARQIFKIFEKWRLKERLNARKKMLNLM